MNELSPNGFYGRQVSCRVYYKSGFFDYEVSKLDDIKQELEYYKNTDAYITPFNISNADFYFISNLF